MAHRQEAAAPLAAAVLLAASFVSPAAQAQTEAQPQALLANPNWYIGASTDDTHVEVFRGLGWEMGGSERGFSVRGGWRFHRNFEVEFGGLRASDLQWSEYLSTVALAAHTSFDVAALTASAVGKVHMGKTFEGYLKVGLAFYDVAGGQVLDTLRSNAAITRDVDDSGSDYLLGGGIAIKASPKWRVRLEYQYFGIDRDFLGVGGGDDPSIDTFSIGLDYQLTAR
jgi:opacity protein-like surface antigen